VPSADETKEIGFGAGGAGGVRHAAREIPGVRGRAACGVPVPVPRAGCEGRTWERSATDFDGFGRASLLQLHSVPLPRLLELWVFMNLMVLG